MKIKFEMLEWVVGIAGYGLLFNVNWKIAVGVALVSMANFIYDKLEE